MFVRMQRFARAWAANVRRPRRAHERGILERRARPESALSESSLGPTTVRCLVVRILVGRCFVYRGGRGSRRCRSGNGVDPVKVTRATQRQPRAATSSGQTHHEALPAPRADGSPAGSSVYCERAPSTQLRRGLASTTSASSAGPENASCAAQPPCPRTYSPPCRLDARAWSCLACQLVRASAQAQSSRSCARALQQIGLCWRWCGRAWRWWELPSCLKMTTSLGSIGCTFAMLLVFGPGSLKPAAWASTSDAWAHACADWLRALCMWTGCFGVSWSLQLSEVAAPKI